MASREFFVGRDHPAAFKTIGEALAVAVDRDEIHVLPGEYRESWSSTRPSASEVTAPAIRSSSVRSAGMNRAFRSREESHISMT